MGLKHPRLSFQPHSMLLLHSDRLVALIKETAESLEREQHLLVTKISFVGGWVVSGAVA